MTDTPPTGLLFHLFGPPPAVDEAPSVGERNWTCYPHAPTVDEVSRTVTCKRCKQQLDPIDVLIMVSRQHEQWTRLLEETSAMRKALEALKAEEKRVKQRTKSHGRKDAAEAVAAERAKLEQQRFDIARRLDEARGSLDGIDRLIGRLGIVRRVRRPRRGP